MNKTSASCHSAVSSSRRSLRVFAAKAGGFGKSGGKSGSKGAKSKSTNPWAAAKNEKPPASGKQNKPNPQDKASFKDAKSRTAQDKPLSSAREAVGAATAVAVPQLSPHMSSPLTRTTLDALSRCEPVETPKWGTFCNHCDGEWIGQYAAYTPWEALPEPVWVDENGKYINMVYTHCSDTFGVPPAFQEHVLLGGKAEEEVVVEEEGEEMNQEGKAGRGDGSQGEAGTSDADLRGMLCRVTARAATLEQLLQMDLTTAPPDTLDIDTYSNNQFGTVSFNGGNYSLGPEHLGRVGDTVITEPTVHIFEQCVVDWGDKTRVRVKVTIKTWFMDNGEVDVEVQRLVVWRERWAGAAGGAVSSSSSAQLSTQRCLELPRPTAAQLTGVYNVFTVSATAVEEVDPLTGVKGTVFVYTGIEERQMWGVNNDNFDEDSGASWYMPGGVIVTLQMVNNGDSSSKAQRGLMLSTTFADERSVTIIEREHFPNGALREARHASAVKGGWSGGRM